MTSPVRAEDLIGRKVGGCRIEALIGRGAMGVVFRGVQESLERPVAVKILSAPALADAASDQRFFHEARAVARVSHPNVVQVHDCGRDEGVAYIVMELIEGESLARLLQRERRLRPAVAVELAIGAARGLEAAHARGLIHRDVKPDNMLVATGGLVKLVDFGLTKDMADSGALTQAGTLLGTPNYMSPEACEGYELDARADLYSLGVTLYLCLAGQLPFSSKTIPGILVAHATLAPPRLRSVAPRVPAALEAIVMKLLEKDPKKRLQTAARLVDELVRFRDGIERPEPPRLVERADAADETIDVPRDPSTVDEPRSEPPSEVPGETFEAPSSAPRAAPATPPPATRAAAPRAAPDEPVHLSVDDLLVRAQLFYLREDWEGAEADLAEATRLAPGNAAAHFALACVLGRQNKVGPALDHLERALAAGYKDRLKIERSRDLESLAGEPRFRVALGRLRRPV